MTLGVGANGSSGGKVTKTLICLLSVLLPKVGLFHHSGLTEGRNEGKLSFQASPQSQAATTEILLSLTNIVYCFLQGSGVWCQNIFFSLLSSKKPWDYYPILDMDWGPGREAEKRLAPGKREEKNMSLTTIKTTYAQSISHTILHNVGKTPRGPCTPRKVFL